MTPATMIEPFIVWLINFSVDLARYLLVAGSAFVVFWIWGRERWRRNLVQGAYPKAEKLWHDVRWSMSTVVIFSLTGVAVFYAGQVGLLRRYETIAEHGWVWFGSTVLLLIVLQDTYFYWTHRALHHRRLYRVVHRVHHQSTNPSPWTAYAFSPGEALVHAAFVPLVWLVVPMHEAAVFVFLAFMITRNVLGHLSIELYWPGFTRSRVFGWHTTTTHHVLHHQYFTSNYGLYFTFWDRLMGTTERRYHSTFERVAAGSTAEYEPVNAATLERDDAQGRARRPQPPPEDWLRRPNVVAGRRLYANDCAACHGATGGGDGAANEGGRMAPPPSAFRGRLME